jgi:hypothetical protein
MAPTYLGLRGGELKSPQDNLLDIFAGLDFCDMLHVLPDDPWLIDSAIRGDSY